MTIPESQAILFVYKLINKKTIYEINNEFKKNIESQSNFQETIDKIQMTNLYINMYKTMLYKIINNETFPKNGMYIDTLNDIFGKLNKTKVKKENIIVINNIFDKFYFIINDNEKYFETIQKVIKKIKNLEFLNKYEKSIIHNDFPFLLLQ